MYIFPPAAWRIIKTFRRIFVGGCSTRALGHTLIDQAADALQLHVGVIAPMSMIYRAAHRHARAHAVADLLQQDFGNALLHQAAAIRAAHLALIEPDASTRPSTALVEIGIFEDDEGRLAAQFQREFLWLCAVAERMLRPTSWSR